MIQIGIEANSIKGQDSLWVVAQKMMVIFVFWQLLYIYLVGLS